MSEAAFTQSKEVRRRCQSCEERKARFRFRGQVKADRDHTLCFECYRAARDRRRAEVLADVRPPRPLVSPFPAQHELSAREIDHRRRMLVHCASTGGA
jgi:hypothetical protein